jgi:hypothetical protein
MPTFDPESGRHLLTPSDDQQPQRSERLRQLGLEDRPEVEFDAFAFDLAKSAADLARLAQAPYAMVNLFSVGPHGPHQYFSGLHVPSAGGGTGIEGAGAQPEVDRVMSRDHGWCPHVVDRRKPLILNDVFAAPRFAGNAVVDMIGIRTYMGAPLIDEDTGIALGTICVIDTEPRPWGREGLDLMKHHRDQLMKLVYRRASALTT